MSYAFLEELKEIIKKEFPQIKPEVRNTLIYHIVDDKSNVNDFERIADETIQEEKEQPNINTEEAVKKKENIIFNLFLEHIRDLCRNQKFLKKFESILLNTKLRLAQQQATPSSPKI